MLYSSICLLPESRGSSSSVRRLGSIWRRHRRNVSLTCPKLIPPGVKHGIGFKDGGVAQVCCQRVLVPPHSRVTSGPGEHAKNSFMHHHRLSEALGKSLMTSSITRVPHFSGPGSPGSFKRQQHICRKPVDVPALVTMMSYYVGADLGLGSTAPSALHRRGNVDTKPLRQFSHT